MGLFFKREHGDEDLTKNLQIGTVPPPMAMGKWWSVHAFISCAFLKETSILPVSSK